ncbi:MAG: peptide ABC transporter substrate-binding protein, partial [Candidatus Eremiobacteraeota bacterium]|nr:peptide ABC transporter substrate-binding protein [Candidatus Eremiobacteraeota bacterium]
MTTAKITAIALAATAFVFSPLSAAQEPLRVALQQEPGTLNPVIGTLAIETDAANLLFDGLFRRDDQGNLVPDLATRVPTRQNGDISRDGLLIRYHLVHNARWSDGEPVTSDDVQFTFSAIMDPRNNVVTRLPYDQFERVDAPDPYTVAIHLKQPFAPALVTTFNDGIQGAIVPAHLLRGVADFNRAPFGTMPVGSGPYKLVSWHHGSDMIFEANPTYHRGAPKIARIVWRFVPAENSILAGLRSHEIDLVDKLGVVPYSQLGHVPGLLPALSSSMGWEHLTFNTSRGALRDVRVRRALCEGFDVREIYAKVIHGIGDLGVALEHPKSPWYDRSLKPCPFDPNHAKALLEQAGWRVGSSGVRMKDGVPLQITFSTVAGIIDREQTEVLLQSHWRELGVELQSKNYPPSTFFAPVQAGGILNGGKFDVALGAFLFASTDPFREN